MSQSIRALSKLMAPGRTLVAPRSERTHDGCMSATYPLKSLVRLGRGRKRVKRYKTVRHQLLHDPTVPGVLELLGIQTADRGTQEFVVQRAAKSGWLLPPERNLMRTAGFPGI